MVINIQLFYAFIRSFAMKIICFAAVIVLLAAGLTPARADDPTPEQLLDAVGLKPQGTRRGQMDIVGFATTAIQMDVVVSQSAERAAPRRAELHKKYGWTDDTAFSAAVCPHDDYYYAGRLYSLVAPHIKAHTVILFGVFHKARVWDLEDKLVFDSFETWHGPAGPVAVSPVRADILSRLPQDSYIVDNNMQQVEHSVEAIVPWLQAYNPDVEIVSILVPYMGWETMDRLATQLAGAVAEIARERGWRLGEDLAVISSADAVHYGDAGWGGSSYADFGTDSDGYKKAVNRDIHLAESTLCGPVTRPALKNFLYTCVDRDNVRDYKLTWCGRFSVPFGLNVASRLSEELDGRQLAGTLLGYGTSVGEVSLDLDEIPGLGTTAPNNLHHWVGYAAIGYW
jgi:AmmeMemoRadiSam system protein B